MINTATTNIDTDTRKKRMDAFVFARGSVQLEGFNLSEEAVAIHMQYVNGEISSEERIKSFDKRHKKKNEFSL